MNALLLAAGLGTRLRPITNSIPKSMVPIMGRPLLDYWCELLSDSRVVNKIFINTHYLPSPVRDYVQASPLLSHIELLHEEKLLGTGGTLKSIINQVGDQDLLVAHADNLTLFDLEEFLLQHQQRPDECVGTMMTFDSDNPRSCGIVELDNRGIVKAFHEKVENPPGTLANAAVFIFSPAALGIISRLVGEGYTDISLDLIPHLLGKLFSFHNGTYHRDIGTLDALAAAETEFPKIYKEFARKGSLQ